MHSKPMSEHEGTFDKDAATTRPCRKCKGKNCRVMTWESSCGGYEDYKYTCGDCGHTWWIDGIDS